MNRHAMHALVVSIADPRYRCYGGEEHSKVRQQSKDYYRCVFRRSIMPDSNHFQEQPSNTRHCASRVDAAKMLPNHQQRAELLMPEGMLLPGEQRCSQDGI